MPAEEKQRFDNMYAQARNAGYEFLSQLSSEPRNYINQMLFSTEYGN